MMGLLPDAEVMATPFRHASPTSRDRLMFPGNAFSPILVVRWNHHACRDDKLLEQEIHVVLERSRKALEEATIQMEPLRAAATKEVDAFRQQFVIAVAMIRRVGSIIDEESRGRRTNAFGEFWTQTADDPLHKFIVEVRNAEFKRGERRQVALRKGTLHASAQAGASVGMTVIRADGSTEEVPTHVSDPPSVQPAPPPVQWSVTMLFAGGAYDGQDVVPLLDQYLTWLKDVVLPTADRLTT